jgi:hypothetical protein
LTEGPETLTVTVQGQSSSITINDTSKTATYSLGASSSSVNEGSSATFTLTTTNVSSGTSVPYTLSGVSAADISGGSLSGNAVVNSSGIAIISVTLLNDLLTEGAETLTITAGSATASTFINDTSPRVTATYSLSSSSSSVNEGSSATFTLTTTSLASGTSVPYTLSGISAADVSGGSLSGNAVINLSGVATISVTLLNDSLTEGAETLTVTAGSANASTAINDTSKGAPTYSLSASSASVDEGAIATFNLLTTNVAAGTSISYSIGGVSSVDITGGALSGVAIVNSSGTATIAIPTIADLATEGAETLTVTAQGKSATMTINDTSKTAVPVVTATAAADTITNSQVSQNIDGGDGIDTLVYTSNSAGVVISKSGGSTLVTNTATGEVDTLSNVERLKFADASIALDINGTAGQAYRVYQAAFNRIPDNGGLKYWIGLMDGGVSLPTVSSAFIASAEFKALYGVNPTNELFVSKLYDNVLHRTPDISGYNYWVGLLNTKKIDNISTLINFSESPENQAGVIGVIQNGIDLLN